jgi:hypothetical protein
MAYDRARGRVVLFGGQANEDFNDTWEWDGVTWTQVADTGPKPRVQPAMAYHGNRNRVVLFGGSSPLDVHQNFNDTWEWDEENWTQVADTGPSGRRGHAMAGDDKRQRIVLFGGSVRTGVGSDFREGNFQSDTWEWDGEEWTKLEDTGPPGRSFHGLAYDDKREHIVLFGGFMGKRI